MKIAVDELQKILDSAVASGEECGCQLTVYRNGRQELALCAGFADAGHTVPVTLDTLFPVYSCGKGVMAGAFHQLVEAGKIAYGDRVADHWPEYGVNGKAETRVWQALAHRAAVHAIPGLDRIDDLADWDLMCSRLAAATPAWTPGGKSAYHGLTFAWLIGEIAARAAGRPFQELIRENIIAPLGLERELFFGLPPEAEPRAAAVTDGPDDDWRRCFINSTPVRRGFMPAANGFGTARALARYYAALISEVDSVRLLRPETVANAAILRRSWDDPLTDTWAKFGLGWALAGEPLGSIFGHGGALGAEGFADRASGLAVGFVKNRINATHPVHPTRDRIAEVLGLPIRHW